MLVARAHVTPAFTIHLLPQVWRWIWHRAEPCLLFKVLHHIGVRPKLSHHVSSDLIKRYRCLSKQITADELSPECLPFFQLCCLRHRQPVNNLGVTNWVHAFLLCFWADVKDKRPNIWHELECAAMPRKASLELPAGTDEGVAVGMLDMCK